MATPLKLWKGAVQPATSGAANLDLKLWKGAIQPAYVAPAGGAGDGRSGPGLSFGSMGKMGA